MAARPPAAAAMAALTLDHLSGGRLRQGIGVSGPQVVERWHGMVFDHPIERTREYVANVRKVLAREGPLTASGPRYPLPLPGSLGKPLKANVVPFRARVPTHLAAMGPKNVTLAAQIAEGWIPFLYSPEKARIFSDGIAEGLTRRAPDLGNLDVAPRVPLAMGPDISKCRDRLAPSSRSMRVGWDPRP